MKKTLSKIKNKPSKRLEQKNVASVIENVVFETQQSEMPNVIINDRLLSQQRDKFNTNKIKTESPRASNVKTRNGVLPDQETEKSSTTYEAFTTSTSESEPARKNNNGKKSAKGNSNQRDKSYTATDPKICITIPDRGRGNVRIVGNNNSGSKRFLPKQVDFASLDEVYGTSHELSSDDEEDKIHLNIKHPGVYRVEDQENEVNENRGPSRRHYLSTDNEEIPSEAGQVKDQENYNPERKKGNEAEEYDRKPSVQPTLTLPLFSVNIRTSEEEEASSGKNESDIRKRSSQLSKIKRHIIETECNVPRGSELKTQSVLENQNRASLRHKIESSEQKTPLKRAKNSGTNTEYELYYIDDKGTDTQDLRSILEHMMSVSNQQNVFHDSNSSQTSEKIQSRRKQKPIESNIENSDNEITTPIIYVATLDNNTVSALDRESKTEANDENKEHKFKATSKYSRRNISSNKICGSKIGIKKSKRSFLKSSFPKVSSLRSKKLSSESVSKKDKNVSGISKTYAIRDVMVIPEEAVGKKTVDIYRVQPLDYEIPEETVILEEREIRLHNMNNDYAYETDPNFSLSAKKDPTSKKINHKTLDKYTNSQIPSIPCLYSSSTSTLIDPEGVAKGSCVGNVMENSNNHKQKLLVSDRPNIASSNSNQQNNENIYDKNIATNYGGGSSTILIGSETHREIMEAINASSSKASIITLSSKMSKKGSTGKRLLLSAKRSKGTNSFKRPGSLVGNITKENSPVESKRHFTSRNIKIVSKDMTDTGRNIGSNQLELHEIRRRDIQTLRETEPNISNPFTGKNYRENTTNILAYSSTIINTLTYDNRSAMEQQRVLRLNQNPKDTRKESKLMVNKSFSEPFILEDSKNDPNVPGSPIKESSEKKVSSRKRRRTRMQNLSLSSPETMVYLGAIPNTTYNVFFSPDQKSNKGDDENGDKRVKSEMKILAPIKSEKLIAQGPKAILIFVNKKTELNRNPFDGNVMYDNDNDRKRYKGKQDKGKDRDRGKNGKDKGKHRGSGSEASGRGKHGTRRGKDRGGEFDVDSNIYGGPGNGYGSDEVVVERSPSGNKTVTKYPCGCMKISKYDPDSETSTDEITSAFCNLGSQCEISQSQTDKRRIKYGYGSESFGENSYTGRGIPKSPQLDIVIEGIMSKKPIKPRPPAQKMNGTNLTGTLTIKTNRCNGVINFYIDPRVKNYLCKNLPCASSNYNDNYRTYS